MMWMALALPPLLLPALLGFSRYEARMMTSPRVRQQTSAE
jgi:hypothetical protein